MMLDVADRHPTRVEADDHLVETAEPTSALRDQPRRETPVPIARRRKLDLTDLGRDRLGREPVTRVREQRRIRIASLITEMIRQLRLQATLQRRLDQLRDQPAVAGHLDIAGIDTRKQVVQRTRRDQRLTASEPDPAGSSVSLTM